MGKNRSENSRVLNGNAINSARYKENVIVPHVKSFAKQMSLEFISHTVSKCCSKSL